MSPEERDLLKLFEKMTSALVRAEEAHPELSHFTQNLLIKLAIEQNRLQRGIRTPF